MTKGQRNGEGPAVVHHRCLPPEVPARAVAGLDSHWTILAKAEESETKGNQMNEDQNAGNGH